MQQLCIDQCQKFVESRFSRGWIMQYKATSNWCWIWDNALATQLQLSLQSSQMHHKWLWFVRCQMGIMRIHPRSNFKPCTQMWSTGTSWLISLKKNSPNRAILLACDITMHLEAGKIGRRMYGIIQTQGNDEWPHQRADLIELLHSWCIQVETGIYWKQFLAERNATTAKDIVKYVVRPA